MKPIKWQKAAERTAERLNLPYEFVCDAVEYFYRDNKSRMDAFEAVIFVFTGLGRFIVRPMKFWRRKEKLRSILDDYNTYRANRGIMIRQELQKRYDQMEVISPAVQDYFDYRNRWKNTKK